MNACWDGLVQQSKVRETFASSGRSLSCISCWLTTASRSLRRSVFAEGSSTPWGPERTKLSSLWNSISSIIWKGSRKHVIVFRSCSSSCAFVNLFGLELETGVLWMESEIRDYCEAFFFPLQQELDLWCLPIVLVPCDLCCGWSSNVIQFRQITFGRPECISATWSNCFQTSAEWDSTDHLIRARPCLFNCRPYSVSSHQLRKSSSRAGSKRTQFFLRSDPTRLRVGGGFSVRTSRLSLEYGKGSYIFSRRPRTLAEEPLPIFGNLSLGMDRMMAQSIALGWMYETSILMSTKWQRPWLCLLIVLWMRTHDK